MDSNDLILTGLDHIQHCRYQEAIAASKKALLRDPSNEIAWLIIGDALYKLKRYQEAVDAYDNVLSITPKNVNVWLNTANALHNLGQLENALEACNHALSIDPALSRAGSVKEGFFAISTNLKEQYDVMTGLSK